jgi:hypothetical protein
VVCKLIIASAVNAPKTAVRKTRTGMPLDKIDLEFISELP